MPVRGRSGETKRIQVYHLSTSSSPQSYSASADIDSFGSLLMMNRYDHALEGGDIVEQWELYCDASLGVLEGDKIVIDSEEYYAKKIFRQRAGRNRHLRITLSKQT